jgi:hypothetical protein
VNVVRKAEEEEPETMRERSTCPACQQQRTHTGEEWRNHPLAGHGTGDGSRWTHERLSKWHGRSKDADWGLRAKAVDAQC